jgi:NADH-quinone oxidoreductase subunit H
MLVVVGAGLTAAGYSTFLERKMAAWMQDRIGPNRAGPWGLLQPLADGVKFLFKEDYIPPQADRVLFVLAPMLALGVALMAVAIIPWGGVYDPEPGVREPLRVQIASIDAGLLYILAVGALAVYGVVLGSWASNNKYSFYGGLRAAAQMLSYEIPMGLAILVVVLTCGELRLERIVESQTQPLFGWTAVLPGWNVFLHPLACFVLLVTALAETNRAPFDLAECEQELVGGFHTEYSAMKFALFFLGEYTHVIVSSALLATLFLGGWHVPGLNAVQHSLAGVALQMFVLAIKIGVLVLLFMWIRWTLPRFRFDQVMHRAWKGLVPLTMAQVAATAVLVYFNAQQSLWAPLTDIMLLAGMGVILSFTEPRVTARQDHLGSSSELQVPSSS